MDKTTKSSLKKSDRIAHQQELLQASDIIDTLHNNKNCLVMMNDGAHKMGVLTTLLRQYISEAKSIWLAFSPITLSPFKLSHIRAGLGEASLSIKCHFEHVENGSLATLWSADVLRDSIHTICSHSVQNLPDVIVIENLDMLDDEYIGPCLEQVMIGLPLKVPMVAFIPFVANHKEILDWLMKIRGNSWGKLATAPDSGHTLTCLTPEYDLTPLLQKKKIAPKVKRLLKENKPIKYPASKSFIAPLLDKLKQENLTPTLVVMPSRELCDQAVQNYPKTRDSATEILSTSQIKTMFDRYPVLKEYTNVVDAAYKQVVAFHSGHHPAWAEMVEVLLSLNLIDAVFTTLYDVQALSSRLSSVVLTTSQVVAPGQIRSRSLSTSEFRRICQLVTSSDHGDHRDYSGRIVLAHGEHIDVTRLKDMLMIPSLSAINSRFECTTQAILALSGSTTRGVQQSVLMSLWAAQHPLKDTAPLVEKQYRLEELIPEARCNSAADAFMFIQKTQQFKFELDQWNLKIKAVKRPGELNAIKQQMATLQLALSSFPCNECAHQGECQGLRYKRIREIFNQYTEMIYEIKQSASIFEVDLASETALLENVGLLDSRFELTLRGKIALQSGCDRPFYVTELIRRKEEFPWTAELTHPVLAGFIEPCPEEIPLLVNDFVDNPLLSAYQWVEECIAPVRKQLCSNGVVIPEPSLAQSALVRAMENGIRIERVAERTRISMGAIMRLVQRVNSIGVRFGL